VNFPVENTTYALRKLVIAKITTDHAQSKQSVSDLVNVVFVYKSTLKFASLLPNCTIVEQSAVIGSFFGQKALKQLKFVGKL